MKGYKSIFLVFIIFAVILTSRNIKIQEIGPVTNQGIQKILKGDGVTVEFANPGAVKTKKPVGIKTNMVFNKTSAILTPIFLSIIMLTPVLTLHSYLSGMITGFSEVELGLVFVAFWILTLAGIGIIWVMYKPIIASWF